MDKNMKPGRVRLIATVDMKSGTFTPYDSLLTRRTRYKPPNVSRRVRVLWQMTSPGKRLTITVLIPVLLAIFLDRLCFK
jgi:hypothetical protein